MLAPSRDPWVLLAPSRDPWEANASVPCHCDPMALLTLLSLALASLAAGVTAHCVHLDAVLSTTDDSRFSSVDDLCTYSYDTITTCPPVPYRL